MSGRRLIVFSKSTWEPAIRREHALVRCAVAEGDAVLFVERPIDVRHVRSLRQLRRWTTGFRPVRASPLSSPHRLQVARPAVVAPGHRSRLWETLERPGLRVGGLQQDRGRTAVVVTVPWRWPSAMRVEGARRIFDCADDWCDLIPGSAERLGELYRAIGREADEIIVVNPALADLFGGREVTVIENGVEEALLDAPREADGGSRRMVYTGTFTDRFAGRLMSDVLDLLPGWTVDLHGQCQYPGAGGDPGGQLVELLERHPERATWHGVAPRTALPVVLDRASVLIVPHLSNTQFGGRRAWGGDVMKLYDYAARGRPIVSTDWDPLALAQGPPGMVVCAHDARDFAEAVLAADRGPRRDLRRMQWARERSWARRWDRWSSVVWGSGRQLGGADG